MMANQAVTQTENSNSLEKTRAARELTPPVDIFENQDELLVVADMPGVELQAIGVHLDTPEFRVEGRVTTADGAEAVYTRSFRIDERIDPERVRAEYKEGVLRVHLGKSAKFRPRKVEVRSS